MIGKNEFIKRIAIKRYGTANNVDDSKLQDCAIFFDCLTDVFTDALLDGEKIMLKGFLTAEARERKSRRGRDPNTGEVVEFPPVKSINIKISKQIKNLVNGKE